MTEWDAVRAAIKVYATPASVRMVRTAPLPTGMTLLLAIATGDANELRVAARALDRDEDVVRDAVSFYVGQVMFAPGADAHRILGCGPDASLDDLKKHRSLLLNWLHPDRQGLGRAGDRATQANRVIEAWRVVSREASDGQEVVEPAHITTLSRHARRRTIVRKTGLIARLKSAFGGL
jgi:hypothetical protein